MKTVFEGFLWALGIMLGLGVISFAVSTFTGNSFISGFTQQSAEFPFLTEHEYGDIKHVLREVSMDNGALVEHKVSGQLSLNESGKYSAVEVWVSLYNEDGIFLGEYTGGKQYTDKKTGIVQFKIDIWDPYNKGEISDVKFKVSAE